MGCPKKYVDFSNKKSKECYKELPASEYLRVRYLAASPGGKHDGEALYQCVNGTWEKFFGRCD